MISRLIRDLHCQLVALLPQVDEAALALGVADVLGPRVVLRVPAVQLLAAEETADLFFKRDVLKIYRGEYIYIFGQFIPNGLMYFFVHIFCLFIPPIKYETHQIWATLN